MFPGFLEIGLPAILLALLLLAALIPIGKAALRWFEPVYERSTGAKRMLLDVAVYATALAWIAGSLAAIGYSAHALGLL